MPLLGVVSCVQYAHRPEEHPHDGICSVPPPAATRALELLRQARHEVSCRAWPQCRHIPGVAIDRLALLVGHPITKEADWDHHVGAEVKVRTPFPVQLLDRRACHSSGLLQQLDVLRQKLGQELMWQEERKRHLKASLRCLWVGDEHIGIVQGGTWQSFRSALIKDRWACLP